MWGVAISDSDLNTKQLKPGLANLEGLSNLEIGHLKKRLLLHFLSFVCIHVHIGMCVLWHVCVEIRGHLVRVGSFLPSCGP